ncbi:MAG: hypothetical protein P4N41_19935 [Negativicutes bacterium]|nr:hypothetical protein [Negativicutes bacterium]MDR3591932.1 hypothetical protein [Negativicutes bacterium]
MIWDLRIPEHYFLCLAGAAYSEDRVEEHDGSDWRASRPIFTGCAGRKAIREVRSMTTYYCPNCGKIYYSSCGGGEWACEACDAQLAVQEEKS